MKFRLLRHLLISVFALLQIIAPLAHAHIDGHQTGALIYSDGIYQSGNTATIHNADTHADQAESPAISMPHELQRKIDYLATEAIPVELPVKSFVAETEVSFSIPHTQHAHHPAPHIKSTPQAP